MDYTNNDGKQPEEVLQLIYGDCALGIHGKDFHYIFSYQFGGPESLVIDGREWLYRVPKPTFWRATTDNDRGNKFSLKSGMWLSADMFIDCIGIKVFVDTKEIELPLAPVNNRYSEQEKAREVKIKYTYQTITVPATIVEVEYVVSISGEIKVTVHYHGKTGLPELPVFGMRFIVPTKAVKYRYEGLSGETYPDRREGGIPGIYEIEGLPVTPYLVPQDCNVHVATKWLEVYRNTTLNNSVKQENSFGLRFSGVDQDFAFSCLPYTSEELENATHQEELPPARRTVISILGAVRGVGGINSWGADVEPPYHIDAGKDISYSFSVLKL
ncbi:MAG: glycoside hydrolase family 42 domain 5 loop region [Herbinix sp.]|jgi:beta-galactosidase|nr:glycoside hydrolase family 42 domain 5 loop region [Herbinix sp.]